MKPKLEKVFSSGVHSSRASRKEARRSTIQGRRQNPCQPAPRQNRGCCRSRCDSGRRWNQTTGGCCRPRPHGVDRYAAGCRVNLLQRDSQTVSAQRQSALRKLEYRLIRQLEQAPRPIKPQGSNPLGQLVSPRTAAVTHFSGHFLSTDPG